MNDVRCVVQDSAFAEGCGAPGVYVFVGCIHEHVYRCVACPKHLAQVRGGGRGFCVPCRQCAEPHHCLVHLLRVGDETVPQRAAS